MIFVSEMEANYLEAYNIINEFYDVLNSNFKIYYFSK